MLLSVLYRTVFSSCSFLLLQPPFPWDSKGVREDTDINNSNLSGPRPAVTRLGEWTTSRRESLESLNVLYSKFTTRQRGTIW